MSFWNPRRRRLGGFNGGASFGFFLVHRFFLNKMSNEKTLVGGWLGYTRD